MPDFPEWMLQLGGYLMVGGMLYGGIRSDLKSMHEKISAALSSAQRAHVRIDDHIDRHHVKP